MIYLDNASTTQVKKPVADLVYKYMTETYGNPSSLHRAGLGAEKAVKNAKGLIAKVLGAKPSQFVFTSGATEGNNTVILGCANSRKKLGKHLITSKVEHPSVLACFEKLEELGFEVTYLDVTQEGVVALESLIKALRPDTQLISIMYVNNELGSINPIGDMTRALKKLEYKGLFHTDATQAIGKVKVNLQTLGVDYLTAAAHKYHGPKGVGFIYSPSFMSFDPFTLGGGQQNDLRSGTHNTPGIVGLAKATALAYEGFEQKMQRIRGFNLYVREALEAFGEEVKVFSSLEHGVPQILDIGFKDMKSEVLLHTLEEHNIMVSSGSACSTNKNQKFSHVLEAIGTGKDFIDGAIRVSFSDLTTKDNIEKFCEILKQVVPQLQETTGKRV